MKKKNYLSPEMAVTCLSEGNCLLNSGAVSGDDVILWEPEW